MSTAARVTAKLKQLDWDFRGAIALRMAAVGLTMAFAFLIVDTDWFTYKGSVRVFATVFDYCLGAFVGAGLAGGLVAPLFGRPGALGWGIALVGALVATCVGALIAGLFAAPQDLGLPIITIVFILIIPPLLLLWLGLMGWLHHWARRHRGLAQS